MSRGAMALLIGAWSVLAAFTARYDLQLSHWLFDSGADWARFGERFGSLPGVYALALAALAAYYAQPPRAGLRASLQCVALWVVGSVTVTVALGASIYRLAGHRLPPVVLAAGCGVVSCGVALGRRRLTNALVLQPRQERTCTALLVLGLSSWAVVEAAKLLWGRVRYRDLEPLGAAFTAWYAPQGHTGHGSFPSGHTAMGWLLMPCILLFPKGSLGRRAVTAAGLCWGTFVGLSRIVIGAHYASDVLFSTALALTFMYFAQLGETRGDALPSPRSVDTATPPP